ncbi:MAG: hypothetical protein IJU32_07860 [Pyramidobacter sp.]|nr:hypothetical protein [Pyramidobacter sp.]
MALTQREIDDAAKEFLTRGDYAYLKQGVATDYQDPTDPYNDYAVTPSQATLQQLAQTGDDLGNSAVGNLFGGGANTLDAGGYGLLSLGNYVRDIGKAFAPAYGTDLGMNAASGKVKDAGNWFFDKAGSAEQKSAEYNALVSNPESWGMRAWGGTFSSLPMMLPSLAIGGGAGLIGMAANPIIAGGLGVTEAAGNAGQEYRKKLAAGITEDEAIKAANQVFLTEAPLDLASEYALGMFGGKGWAKNIIRNDFLRNVVGEGLQEGLQETYQGIIQDAAENAGGKDWQEYGRGLLEESKNAGKHFMEEGTPAIASGMLMAAVTGGLGALRSGRRLTPQEKQTAANVQKVQEAVTAAQTGMITAPMTQQREGFGDWDPQEFTPSASATQTLPGTVAPVQSLSDIARPAEAAPVVQPTQQPIPGAIPTTEPTTPSGKPAQNVAAGNVAKVGEAIAQNPVVQPADQVAGQVTDQVPGQNPAQNPEAITPQPAPVLDPQGTEQGTPQQQIPAGNSIKIVTPDGNTEIDAHYAVVPAESLTASNTADLTINPAFPAQFQPRDRSNAESMNQINAITKRLDPARLTESRLTSEGAPIVDASGIVESGNGRTLALMRGYRGNASTMQAYRQHLIDNAAKFGLDPQQIASTPNPVLVRVRDTPMTDAQRIAFATGSNQSSIAGMSATETARIDAGRLTSDILTKYDPNLQPDAAGQREFHKAFLASIPQNEHNTLIKDGRPTQALLQRERNALIYAATGDEQLAARMTESTDDNVRTVSQAIVQAAPTLARINAEMQTGRLRSEYSLGKDLADAANWLSELRANGEKAADHLNQLNAFSELDHSEETKLLLAFFDQNKRASKIGVIRNALLNYARSVESLGSPDEQSLFDDVTPPAKIDLLRAALDRAMSGEGTQGTLFGCKDAMYIGQKGARSIDAAGGLKYEDKASRMYNNWIAEQMEKEGRSKKEIFFATGWQRLPDGHWRYEIADGMPLRLPGKTAVTKENRFTLSDVYDAPQLYEAYSQLKTMPVFFRNLGKTLYGYASTLQGSGAPCIVINTSLLNLKSRTFTSEGIRTLVHEVQHVVQSIEGFARGGSSETAQRRVTQKLAELQNEFEHLKMQKDFSVREYAEKRIYKDLAAKRAVEYSGTDQKEAARLWQQAQEAAKDVKEFEKGLTPEIIDRYDKLDTEIRKLSKYTKKAPYDIYRALLGETEARNTEFRYGMSEAHRRIKTFDETADIQPNDTISLDAENAPAPLPAPQPKQQAFGTSSGLGEQGDLWGNGGQGRLFSEGPSPRDYSVQKNAPQTAERSLYERKMKESESNQAELKRKLRELKPQSKNIDEVLRGTLNEDEYIELNDLIEEHLNNPEGVDRKVIDENIVESVKEKIKALNDEKIVSAIGQNVYFEPGGRLSKTKYANHLLRGQNTRKPIDVSRLKAVWLAKETLQHPMAVIRQSDGNIVYMDCYYDGETHMVHKVVVETTKDGRVVTSFMAAPSEDINAAMDSIKNHAAQKKGSVIEVRDDNTNAYHPTLPKQPVDTTSQGDDSLRGHMHSTPFEHAGVQPESASQGRASLPVSDNQSITRLSNESNTHAEITGPTLQKRGEGWGGDRWTKNASKATTGNGAEASGGYNVSSDGKDYYIDARNGRRTEITPDHYLERYVTSRVKKIAEAFQVLKNASETPIRQGVNGAKAGVRGYFDRGRNSIHVKAYNDIITAAHEVGHSFDARMKLRDQIADMADMFQSDSEIRKRGEEIYGELCELGKGTSPGNIVRAYENNDGSGEWMKARDYLMKEGIAEAFSLSAVNRTLFEKTYPAYATFFNEQLEANPQYRATIEEAWNAIAAYEAQPEFKKLQNEIGGLDTKLNNVHSFRDALTAAGKWMRWAFDDKGVYLKEQSDNLLDFAVKNNLTQLYTTDKKGNHYLRDDVNVYALWRTLAGTSGKADEHIGKFVETMQKAVGKEDFDLFSAYLVAQHAEDYYNNNLNPGLPGLATIDDVQARLNDIRREYASRGIDGDAKLKEFARVYDELMKDGGIWDNAVVKPLIEQGIWTRKTYNEWRKKFPHYVPFYRDMTSVDEDFLGRLLDPTARTKGDGRGTGNLTDVKDPLSRKKTGVDGVLAVKNPIVSMLLNIQLAQQMVAKNEVIGALVKTAQTAPNFFSWLAEPLSGRGEMEAEYKISHWENGKKKWYAVDKDTYKAFQAIGVSLGSTKAAKLARIITNLFTGGTTRWNLGFIIPNVLKDSQGAAMNSDRWGAIPIWNSVKGILTQIAKENGHDAKHYLEAIEAGVIGGHMTEINGGITGDRESAMKRFTRRAFKQSTMMEKTLGTAFRNIGEWNEMIELAPKVEEFARLRERGVPMKQAAIMAREVNIDFSRGGALAKAASAYIPFFNAGIQGSSKSVRSLKANSTMFLTKSLLFAVLPQMLLRLAHDDDDEYKNLDRDIRNKNFVFRVGNHFWKLPIAEGVGRHIAAGTMALFDKLAGSDPDAFKGLAHAIIEDYAPGMFPAFLKPIAELGFNKDFYTWSDIVPRRLQDLPPALQFDERTSTPAKVLGQAFNISPVKIDHYVRSALGPVGNFALRSYDTAKNFFIDEDKPGGTPYRELRNQDLFSRFSVNEEKQNNTRRRFYDYYDEVKKDLAMYDYRVQNGETVDRAEHAKLRRLNAAFKNSYQHIHGRGGSWAQLNLRRKAIEQSKTLTGEQKRQKIQQIDRSVTKVMQRAVDEYYRLMK